METKSLENPLIQVLKLVVADPKLRRKFIHDPAAVFKQVGLGCPLNFVGRQGNFCPVMPKLPEDESAATDIGRSGCRVGWISLASFVESWAPRTVTLIALHFILKMSGSTFFDQLCIQSLKQ